VAKATRLVTGAGGIALDGDVRFLGEFSVVVGTFAPGQVLIFGTLAYIANSDGELCPIYEAALVSSKLPARLIPRELSKMGRAASNWWLRHGRIPGPNVSSHDRAFAHRAVVQPLA
jgi:hypothetical protein